MPRDEAAKVWKAEADRYRAAGDAFRAGLADYFAAAAAGEANASRHAPEPLRRGLAELDWPPR